MFQLIKGACVRDSSKLQEQYEVNANGVQANISAQNIIRLFDAFLGKMKDYEPLFLFIEAPCKEDEELELNRVQQTDSNELQKFHANVYYLDGLFREDVSMLLHSGVGELLIHDGLVSFGVGSLDSHIEIGKYKYNVINAYPYNNPIDILTDIFDEMNIPRVPELLTAWQLLSKENPGICSKIEHNGKDVYDLIENLRELGLYKAETREQD